MHAALDLVVLLSVAAAAAGLAGRLGLSAPLLLTALGLVLSFVPDGPDIPLTPDVVLFGLLPPLLYAAAIRTPWVDLRRNARAISLLSVGLVLVTAFAVAGVVVLLLDVPFALALALGAVVAPPDAVAATAVARRVGMPRRVVQVLEGESLLNDATALVTLRTALAATAGAVSLAGVAVDFVIAVAAGLAAGWLTATVITQVRRRLVDPVLDTTMSLLAPFIAFIGAEELHGSGVIAVVIAGLMLGHRSPEIQSASSRVTERTLWRTVQFLLESVVFLLIGLQLSRFLEGAVAADVSIPTIAVLCVAVLAAVIVVRFLWVFPAIYLPRLVPAIRRADPAPPASHAALVSWAGMRGVVTIAAVLAIPEEVEVRPVLVAVAFAVVAGTLLIQGTTLPLMVRVLRVRGPDPVQDSLQEALVAQRAARAGLTWLDDTVTERDPRDVVEGLRSWGGRVANAAWERLGPNGNGRRETPAAAFQRLRVGMLEAERRVVTEVLHSGSVPPDVVAPVLERLDQEEAMLVGFSQTGAEPAGSAPAGPGRAGPGPLGSGAVVSDSADDTLTATAAPPGGQVVVEAPTGACEHLRAAPLVVAPASPPDACPDCLAIGEDEWVHLRMCLTCGHIGCCDSSPRRHADAHHTGTGHPVMRSVELGEAWRWCFVDHELG